MLKYQTLLIERNGINGRIHSFRISFQHVDFKWAISATAKL